MTSHTCQHLAGWIKIIIEKSHTVETKSYHLEVSYVKNAERQISLYYNMRFNYCHSRELERRKNDHDVYSTNDELSLVEDIRVCLFRVFISLMRFHVCVQPNRSLSSARRKERNTANILQFREAKRKLVL